MSTMLNEIKRMQQLAGIITEAETAPVDPVADKDAEQVLKMALNMFNPSGSDIKSDEDTWEYMRNSPIIKAFIKVVHFY